MDTYDSISVATRQHTLGGILCVRVYVGGCVGWCMCACGEGGGGVCVWWVWWLKSMICRQCEVCIAGVHINGLIHYEIRLPLSIPKAETLSAYNICLLTVFTG